MLGESRRLLLVNERAKRAGEAIRRAGADWGILSGFENVCYAAGHVASIEDGLSPFAGGPSTAFVSKGGDVVGLVIPNVEAGGENFATITEIYTGYSAADPIDQEMHYVSAVTTMAKRLDVGGRIAIEPATFPASLLAALDPIAQHFENVTVEMAKARAIKTPGEIDLLRHCAKLAAMGQRAALMNVRPYRNEFDAWGMVRAAMEHAENRRLTVVADFLTGIERTAAFTGPPTNRVAQPGDPVIVDLGPRAANGYWGDSCNTFVLGEPSTTVRALHQAAINSLEECERILRPGVRANELDHTVRAVLRKCGFEHPHHTGHGIGAGIHEYPRIIEHETAVLESGMVLMIEPGAYAPGIGGVRHEYMYLVTESGNQRLSTHEHTLTPP
jgi:Xaa-Pro aminopeptidase